MNEDEHKQFTAQLKMILQSQNDHLKEIEGTNRALFDKIIDFETKQGWYECMECLLEEDMNEEKKYLHRNDALKEWHKWKEEHDYQEPTQCEYEAFCHGFHYGWEKHND